ncbi:MAG TPA: amidase, partial [Polyangiaceae bacterium]|nr:amidase [Polyangiaceae bacterium]
MTSTEDELTELTVAEAARHIRDRKVSPIELTEAYLARIERLNPKINAYVTVTAERALADAHRATEEIARHGPRGPLHGIPIALKDLFETAGIRTTAGSRFFAEYVPEADCTAARRLREAGSVLLGKLNTHEFAYGVTTDNPHFGATRNPWDPSRIPGGSSGGSGAAIAASLAATTLGTDTGGSIRIPASLCGAVGLKPTYGRASKAGVFPLSYIFDHPGPIARTVEDAALVLEAIAGYDPADPATVRVPSEDYGTRLVGLVGLAHQPRGLKGLRVGVPRKYFYERLDDDVASALEAAIGVLTELGAEVRDLDIALSEGAVMPLFSVVLAEAQQIHAERLRTRPGDFGQDLLAILSQTAPTAAEVTAGLLETYKLTSLLREALETVDVLVTPTTPVPAVKIGQETVRYGGAEEPVLFAMVRCTGLFNATHLPALSLPCGFSRDGLPNGLQIAGRPFDESTVLAAGHAYERATEWHRRRPRLD